MRIAIHHGIWSRAAAAARLPSAKTRDKILRDETKLERQMDRAMAQLERVQRIRRASDPCAALRGSIRPKKGSRS